ncbi:MAG: rhodanese-like domain-containing protein [Vicinamibacteria bacterium]
MRYSRHPSLIAALTLALVAASQTEAATSPRDSLVVSASWLAEHLLDPDLVLLHVGDRKEYATSHIPGARFVGLDDIATSDHSGLMLEMLPPETLHDRLAILGISDTSRIIVYFGKDWVSPATRVIFTLDYAGLGARTSLLDGGQGAWVRSGHPVTASLSEVKPGTLSSLKVRPLVVTKEFVRDHLGKPGHAVVDGRNAGFYDGVQTGGGNQHPHRTGHIAGAGSLPFTETTDDALLLASPDDLKTKFVKAGVRPGDTVIGYCHLGQQATAVLFAARTLGYKVLLYDGSFEDWTRFPDFPVENPAAASKAPAPKEN